MDAMGLPLFHECPNSSGVNFTNMFTASLYTHRFKQHKKTVKTSVSFLGSARSKAAHKTLVKLTTGTDAIKKFTPSFGIPYLGV